MIAKKVYIMYNKLFANSIKYTIFYNGKIVFLFFHFMVINSLFYGDKLSKNVFISQNVYHNDKETFYWVWLFDKYLFYFGFNYDTGN